MAKIVFCPYDTAGEPEEIMPCLRDGYQNSEFVGGDKCNACMLEWLQKECR